MIWLLLGYTLIFACALRVLLRPDRDPASRAAWLVTVLALPGLGVIAYMLLGETNIGRKRTERVRAIAKKMQPPVHLQEADVAALDDSAVSLFRVGQSISGYQVTSGNRAELMADSDTTIDRMISDIEAAKSHVHLMFYIWLTDTNGMKMVDALMRAARRGVTVRAMVDDLGSRDMVRSHAWKKMKSAGIHTGRALKIGNPLMHIFGARIDLRNHRKVIVIDNEVTYCGSQNCADPAYLPKAKFAPWVDAVMRFEGPVVRQNQHLFVTDWMANESEDISNVLREPETEAGEGFHAQVIATGPTVRASAMPEVFASCMFAARRRLVISTPYYVPNAMVQAALTGAALRGVDTSLVLPKRNDDFAVGAASRSYYDDLLRSGVRVFEYVPGLLHSKSLTIDDDVTLIGSANVDRRSFDLNYENNILLYDKDLTQTMRARQMEYIRDSEEVLLSDVDAWPATRRLWNNTLAVLSPVL